MANREFNRHHLSSLCGDMDAESFNALVQDIRDQGQLEPINVVADEVLDGWHRYRACRVLEIEPKTRDLPEGSDLVAYVLGKNAHRRHMTGEQRAAVVLLAAEWMPAHRPAAKEKGDTVSPLSNDAAAARAGVSKRTVQRVKAQIQAGHGEALATGSETLRSLSAKARKAASAKGRADAGKAEGGEEVLGRSKVAELRREVAFLKTEIEKRDARIAELMEEVESLTEERDGVTEEGEPRGVNANLTPPQGSRALVARWLVVHHAAMLRSASSFADSVHAPEDIVARARFVALERHMEAGDVDSPRGWVLAITKSVGLQVVRKRDRRSELRGAALPDDADRLGSGDEDVFQQWPDENRDQVLEIAQDLPDAIRELVDDVLIDGLDDDEIAKRHGITRSAVRQRRRRAIEAIQRRLPAPLQEADPVSP